MDNKVLVVLGMHRSGTSLITQWLYKCGLHIGEELLEANVGNVEGHFEDQDFLNLHIGILKSNQLSTVGLIDNKATVVVGDEYLEKLRTLINFKKSLHLEWGWKEPRTCLFLDYYRPLLPNAKYLIILRDYNTVVNSLIKRDFKRIEKIKLSKSNTFERIRWNLYRRQKRQQRLYKELSSFYTGVWINYNEKLINHINTIDPDNFILINYQMLLNNSNKVFEHLTNKWSFNLRHFEFNSIYKVSLISKIENVNNFVKDKSLIRKAKELETMLSKYEFIR